MKLMLALTPILLLLLVCSVDATQTVYSSTYLGIPSYNTYINFDSTRTFSTLYRNGNNWIIDDYVLSVENSNMTISSFFENNQLSLTLSIPSGGESTFTVNATDNGYVSPNTITPSGATGWDTQFSDGLLTITTQHVGEVTYEIFFNQGTATSPPVNNNPPNIPYDTDTTTPAFPFTLPDESETGDFNKHLIMTVIALALIAIFVIIIIKKRR